MNQNSFLKILTAMPVISLKNYIPGLRRAICGGTSGLHANHRRLNQNLLLFFFIYFFFDITTMDFIPFTWYVIVNSSRILYQNKSTNNSTMLRAAFIKKSLFRAVI